LQQQKQQQQQQNDGKQWKVLEGVDAPGDAINI
jgi:hypothetical protein